MQQFFNKEISWLEFNYRVLSEAMDQKQPLFERLNFLTIFSANLDEFVMTSIADLIDQIRANSPSLDNRQNKPLKLLKTLEKRISQLVNLEYSCFNQDIIKCLKKNQFEFYTAVNIPKKYILRLKKLFLKKFYLILTPMAIDQARPFPFVKGKSLNIIVKLNKKQDNTPLFAIVPVPGINRFIPIPGEEEQKKFIYLEELIKLFIDQLFQGYQIISSCTFRITRDADFPINERKSRNLLITIKNGLKQRAKGEPIRLEIEAATDQELIDYLLHNINFYTGFYFPIDGPLDLSAFYTLVNHYTDQEKLFGNFNSLMPRCFADPNESIFNIISAKDRLIHHPYESFQPIIRFLEEAALDKKVLAIKLTLYRTSGDASIINALKKAAEKGKQVTVLVELKAKFDEEQNITWAKQLEEAGCHVIYGLVGLKIHCKIALVVRDEKEGIKRYLHLSTGNYNSKTARIYTDIGIFTAKKSFGQDASAIFNLLTGFSEPPRWNQLVCAPYDLRNFFLEKIEIEKENVKKGGNGKIIAKLNALVDTKIINALYEAGQAGVVIQLIVRGMCRLKPQVKSFSENISVISIVNHFLEHSRIYYFYNAGEEDIFLSSADWRERNLDRRVEILFPVTDPDHCREIIYYLNLTLNDNSKAWKLQENGHYRKIKTVKPIINGQVDFYHYIEIKNKLQSDPAHIKIIPKMNPDQNKMKEE